MTYLPLYSLRSSVLWQFSLFIGTLFFTSVYSSEQSVQKVLDQNNKAGIFFEVQVTECLTPSTVESLANAIIQYARDEKSILVDAVYEALKPLQQSLQNRKEVQYNDSYLLQDMRLVAVIIQNIRNLDTTKSSSLENQVRAAVAQLLKKYRPADPRVDGFRGSLFGILQMIFKDTEEHKKQAVVTPTSAVSRKSKKKKTRATPAPTVFPNSNSLTNHLGRSLVAAQAATII